MSSINGENARLDLDHTADRGDPHGFRLEPSGDRRDRRDPTAGRSPWGSSTEPVTTQAILATATSEEGPTISTHFGQGGIPDSVAPVTSKPKPVQVQGPAPIDVVEPFQPAEPEPRPRVKARPPRCREPLGPVRCLFSRMPASRRCWISRIGIPCRVRPRSESSRPEESRPSWVPSTSMFRRRRGGHGRVSPRAAAVRSFPRPVGSGPVQSQAIGLSASRTGHPIGSTPLKGATGFQTFRTGSSSAAPLRVSRPGVGQPGFWNRSRNRSSYSL